eukprot:790968-Amphidinium_carterae.2
MAEYSSPLVFAETHDHVHRKLTSWTLSRWPHVSGSTARSRSGRFNQSRSSRGGDVGRHCAGGQRKELSDEQSNELCVEDALEYILTAPKQTCEQSLCATQFSRAIELSLHTAHILTRGDMLVALQ